MGANAGGSFGGDIDGYCSTWRVPFVLLNVLLVLVPCAIPVHATNARRSFVVFIVRGVFAMFPRLGLQCCLQVVNFSLPPCWRMRFVLGLVCKYRASSESTFDSASMCAFFWHLDIVRCQLHRICFSAFFVCMAPFIRLSFFFLLSIDH